MFDDEIRFMRNWFLNMEMNNICQCYVIRSFYFVSFWRHLQAELTLHVLRKMLSLIKLLCSLVSSLIKVL